MNTPPPPNNRGIDKRKDRTVDSLETNLATATAANAQLSHEINPRWYPAFHIAAQAGWINDPNGLCYFNDRYHVFFQHHPYSAHWGPMHWGHVTSRDLVHFHREPIALAPSIEADRDGVFSGSGVVGPDGKLELFYTGHRWRNGVDEADGNLQVQCRARSTDGQRFNKLGVVIDEVQGLRHFRDPKVFRAGEQWLMVVGACSATNRGQVLLYRSSDLSRWDFDSVLYEDPDPDVFMLECPDFFPLVTPNGARYWVLTYCPMGKRKSGYDFCNDHTAGYVVGTWAEGDHFRAHTPFRMIDHGNEFYAPQTLESSDGRRIMFAWMGSFTIPAPPQTESDGWFGQLTVPRELSLTDELWLHNEPIAGLARLREDQPTVSKGQLAVPPNELHSLCREIGPFDMSITVDRDRCTAERYGVLVHHTYADRGTYIAVDEQQGRLVVDRRTTGLGNGGYRSIPLTGGALTLRILVDNGSVEVFCTQADGTTASLTSYSFPSEGSRGVALLAESGEAAFSDVRMHRLGSIWDR